MIVGTLRSFVVRRAGPLLAGTIAVYFAVTVLPFRPANPFTSSHFQITSAGAIAIPGASLFASMVAPTPLEGAAFRDGRFTIELDAVAAAEGRGPARIIAHTRDAGAHNWMVGQDGSDLVLRHRGRSATIPGALRPGHRARWTLALEGDRVTLTGRDGGRKSLPLAGPAQAWVPRCWLTLVNESTGDRPWTGVIHRLRIGYGAGNDLQLTADSTGLAPDGTGADVPLRRIRWPWIRKLRGALRAFPSDDPFDVAANVAMTVPLGFLFAAWIGAPWRRGLIALLALQVVITTLAESIQMVSLYRQPDVNDLVSNLAGALIGAGLARRAVLQQRE